jgi:hypothetical protein
LRGSKIEGARLGEPSWTTSAMMEAI